jgi:4-hydroxybenzoate polyprenyltransferase
MKPRAVIVTQQRAHTHKKLALSLAVALWPLTAYPVVGEPLFWLMYIAYLMFFAFCMIYAIWDTPKRKS